jgi:hypothetical protein
MKGRVSMNIMKVFGAALTVSMLGSAVALADTVAAPQATDWSHLSKAELASTSTGISYEGKVLAGADAHQPAKPPAFADFGQRDEAGTEN